ncbi:MAG: MerR family transcriptional regulator [SAR324 cluster bacterium]|nr:MerR family transcriptional regulator [SAR324 cluster bacterium]
MKIEIREPIKIGKLAKSLGITTRTIRYYEEIGLMPPPERQDGGGRIYNSEEVLRLKFILKLKELGLSLDEGKELAEIYETESQPVKLMPRLLEMLDGHILKIDEKLSSIMDLRKEVTQYRAKIVEKMNVI